MQIFEPPPTPRVPRPRGRAFRLPALRLRLRPPGFLRRPLAWVVAVEAAVTIAFVVAALHLLSRSVASAGVGPAPQLPPAGTSTSTPAAPAAAGVDVAPAAGSRPPHPGLGQSSAFLGGLLGGLNHDQAASEHAQWSALQALSGAIRTYIEDVVLPAVERAARSARSP